MSHKTAPSPIFSRFHASAQRNPKKIALVAGAHPYRYEELAHEVDALTIGLISAGIKTGDHVGVVLPNCAPFVVLLLAAARLGIVLVPQSPGLSPEAISSTFAASDVDHLAIWHALCSGFEATCVQGARIAVGSDVDGWLAYHTLLHATASALHMAPLLPEDHPYLLVLTSGSTGRPKPIVLSQDTKVKRVAAASHIYGVTAGDVTLAATPLYHSLAQRLVLMPLLAGGTSVVMEHFTPAVWADTVQQYGVTFSIAVSSQLKAILAKVDKLSEKTASLRCLVSSSALLDDPTKSALLKHFACDFHECYGASEIAIATNLDAAAAARRLGSVGTAIPGVDVRILGNDSQLAAPGIAGEIICRTPMRYSGYYRQPEVSAAAQWGDYFRTGDLGRMDEEGYLWFLGRIKDIIITGGVNVYPKDIEDVILTHPAIRECAAIPLADEDLGEVVGVVIAFEDSEHPPEMREIQRLCMQRLGDYQQPRRFVTVDELPKNAMGKIDKPALRAAYSGQSHNV